MPYFNTHRGRKWVKAPVFFFAGRRIMSVTAAYWGKKKPFKVKIGLERGRLFTLLDLRDLHHSMNAFVATRYFVFVLVSSGHPVSKTAHHCQL